jgi:hypothetical protein
MAQMFSEVRQQFGRLDAFISNARPELPSFYQTPLELTLDHWSAAIDSQARAFLVGVQHASDTDGRRAHYRNHVLAWCTYRKLAAMVSDGAREGCS